MKNFCYLINWDLKIFVVVTAAIVSFFLAYTAHQQGTAYIITKYLCNKIPYEH